MNHFLGTLLSIWIVFSAFGASAHAKTETLKNLNGLRGMYQLPKLPYAEDALTAAIDAETMKIHHGKHHQAYVDKLNEALPKSAIPLGKLLGEISKHPKAVRNNAGGHWNHSLFWTVLTPDAKSQALPSRLQKEIEKKFGSVDELKKEMETKGAGQFGSGWVWLIRNDKKELEVVASPNQDNPLMDDAPVRGTPIFGIDVWEHAYYLRYQNKRGEYLTSLWKIVNWAQVDAYDREALK